MGSFFRFSDVFFRRPIASRIASSGIKLIIRSLCDDIQDLHVDINSASNRDLLGGRLRGVSVSASRLQYNNIRVSGGVGLYTDAVELLWEPGSASPRIARPMPLSATVALTARDINSSKPIRDVFHSLLIEVIRACVSSVIGRWLPKQLGGVEYTLNSVEFSEDERDDSSEQRAVPDRYSGGCVILDASAKFGSGKVVNFKVKTGLVTRKNGRVVALHNPVVSWRGFILPLFTAAFIGVELAPEALLTSITVRDGMLAAEGIVVINPPAVLRKEIQKVSTDVPALKEKGFRWPLQ